LKLIQFLFFVFQEFFMLIRSISMAVVIASLCACSSGVKLNEVPVENKSATAVNNEVNAPGIGAGSAVGQNSVAGVMTEKSAVSKAGPTGSNIVFFDYDSFTLKPEARTVIEKNAQFLQSNKQNKAMLEGHTDERGGREYNLALGQKRAESVRRAMTLLGVSDSQIEAVSFGKEKPADSGMDESALAKNRRVEIKY
jgi:peptidoglycan-associated lipoprotein